jgi:hypothetical protein
MSLLTDIIPFSMTDNERGAVVNRNLSYLTAELAADGLSISLKDGTANALFGANEIIIDLEDILVGSVNAITRERNGTTGAIHKVGAVVRLKGGTEIAEFTFTGAETITGIWVSGNAPAMYQFKFNADLGPMKFTGGMGQEVFLPFSEVQPGVGGVITVLAWTNVASLNTWAYVTR